MRSVRYLPISLALAALIGGGYLYAQPAGDTDDDGADVTVPGGKEATLSPGEMKTRAEQQIDEMKTMLTRVVELQKVARKQKDVIKLNCVNDKLLQVKQLLNIAESSRNELSAAIVAEDEAERYHQYGQVTISFEKVSGLRDEAEACIGEELIFLGPTEVDVDRPDISDDPTDDDPFDFEMDAETERAAYATPFF